MRSTTKKTTRRYGTMAATAAALGLSGALLGAACGGDGASECDLEPDRRECKAPPCDGHCTPRVLVDGRLSSDFYEPSPIYLWQGKRSERPDCEALGLDNLYWQDSPSTTMPVGDPMEGARCPSCECEPLPCEPTKEIRLREGPGCDPNVTPAGFFMPLGAPGGDPECIRSFRGRSGDFEYGPLPAGSVGSIGPIWPDEGECRPLENKEEKLANFEQVAVWCQKLYVGGTSCDRNIEFCVPPLPEGFRVCVAAFKRFDLKEVTCPTPYTEKITFYTELEGCSRCNCDQVDVPKQCELTYSFFQDPECQDLIATEDAVLPPACLEAPPGVALGSMRVDLVKETPAKCTPSSREQIGEIKTFWPQSLCCIPSDSGATP